MKKNFLLIISTLIMANLNAQITLTSANTPQIGNSFDYILVQSPAFDVRHSGANQTWDFSSLSGATGTFSYVNLASSSEPSIFQLANIVEISSGTENYYSKSTSEYSLEGQFIPGILRLIYTDKREFLKFPITFNDVFNETFGGTLENIGAGQTFNRSGTIEIAADGFGTLILPHTTINNVLRVRSVLNYDDVYMGALVNSGTDTIDVWFDATTNNLIANVSVLYVEGNLSIYQATYLAKSGSVGVANGFMANEGISFYPNPANNNLVIDNAYERDLQVFMILEGNSLKHWISKLEHNRSAYQS